MSYCKDYFNYRRRQSNEVRIGSLRLGGNCPVRLQSMTNTSTLDTEASIRQSQDIIQAGGELVRLTAQGVKEAENLANIRSGLREKGIETPLVADIHFNPKAAEAAAHHVEKVRINPGNFADPMPAGIKSEEEVQAAIRARFVPFLNLCKAHQTAIRIGVNHGSLSARMMDRHGDTPEGMVASCMEYLRICIEEEFFNVVISIKASNTLVMVQTVRLLVQEMDKEDMHFPLHLGVTEAGDGEDGRVKSAVGIGALLADGIGDTIRVSLSEDPQVEIPVARKLRDYVEKRADHPHIQAQTFEDFNPFRFQRRESHKAGLIGGGQVPIVIADLRKELAANSCTTNTCAASTSPNDLTADFYYLGNQWPDTSVNEQQEANEQTTVKRYICDAQTYLAQAAHHEVHKDIFPLFQARQLQSEEDWQKLLQCRAEVCFLQAQYSDIDETLIDYLKAKANIVLLLESHHQNPVGEMRAVFHRLMQEDCLCPVVLKADYQVSQLEDLQLFAAADAGALLLDGFGDGLFISSPQQSLQENISTMLAILQAARLRISRTEYISCPSCGRTLFNLQKTIAHVKAGTAHLKGLKIAIMGCIVNGPGEMADADYGYVGAGRGKVSLYKAQTCIKKNIPEEEALPTLLKLIEEYEG